MAAIELRGVTKRFGDVTAVDDLDLTVPEGEVFGFLGPNGAGKSTTINLLLDFVRPTTGSVTVLGRDAQAESVAVRRRTGVLPEGFGVYDRLTGRKHVAFAMDSKGVEGDPDATLERVGLGDAAGRKAGGYSKGMCQRLALAMALVGKPRLLVLDEPSSGLDPGGAREMRDIVREEAERGATVFFSSHVLGQVEAVCDRVGIMREGRLIAQDSIAGLRDAAGHGERLIVTLAEGGTVDLDAIRALDGVSDAAMEDGTVTVACDPDEKTAVIAAIEEGGATVEDFTTESVSLEDLFLAYTEGSAAEQADAGTPVATGARSGASDAGASDAGASDARTGDGGEGDDGDDEGVRP